MVSDSGGSGGYDTFDHTADVGLRVWGADLTELFEQAAEGLIELLVDPATVRRARSVQIEAAGEEVEDLLVSWLSEILFAFDAESLTPVAVEVTAFEEARATGVLWGEDLDPARHQLRQHVKAVTYHNLAIRRVGGRFEVRIVFDV